MKIIVGRFLFLNTIKQVYEIIPKNPCLPTLSCILIETKNNGILLSGTDLDVSSRIFLDCKIKERGAFVIHAKQLLDIVCGIKESNINIESNNDEIIINETKINGILSSDDFPQLKDSIIGEFVSFPVFHLEDIIEKIRGFVSVDFQRSALMGIYCKITSDEIIMVATDGHRLSFCKKQIGLEIKNSIEMIIPNKTIEYVLYLLSKNVILKGMYYNKNETLFDFSNVKIWSKLIDGIYPNYEQVIPKNNSKIVYINNQVFKETIKSAIPFLNNITKQIKLIFLQNRLEIILKNSDTGIESKKCIDIKYENDSITTAFNANFLLEILNRIETDTVRLELETPATACIIKPVLQFEGLLFNTMDLEYYYLLMPLRLTD